MTKALVAYFSASGTTARVAGELAEAAGADLFEIEPAQPYTGAFATNLEAQLGYSMEEPQRMQVVRLADFEFDVPAEFLERHGDERDAFTKDRLAALNRYILHIVRTAAGMVF